ncbi:helix-turn-helix domain-containing protein [Paenibacillus hunanensis]|uniref:helix-turn-helix domain-containing protein n=1 Tax=Paenibacillus hunanensis TaxID=539262 RepID=UPI002026FEDF|nr:helix-turn-helix transcriptional regulator [Paenibacillus hunanensis]MCL9662201.1 helix-turn-helix domain-containing protein [Paenibacillus hunanensis]
MRTNDIVIENLKSWMSKNKKSIQWLANEMSVSESLIEHILSGERVLLPKRIIELAELMNLSVKELTKDSKLKEKRFLIQVRGGLTNRRSKLELSDLLFEIEDYIGLKKLER